MEMLPPKRVCFKLLGCSKKTVALSHSYQSLLLPALYCQLYCQVRWARTIVDKAQRWSSIVDTTLRWCECWQMRITVHDCVLSWMVMKVYWFGLGCSLLLTGELRLCLRFLIEWRKESLLFYCSEVDFFVWSIVFVGLLQTDYRCYNWF